MLIIIRSKINSETLKQVAEDLKGYVKVVVDVRRKILSAGGEKHVDGEQLLLKMAVNRKIFGEQVWIWRRMKWILIL